MPRKQQTESPELTLVRRFVEIEEKYRLDGAVRLGEATPAELRELASIQRQLDEIRAQPQEAAV